MELLGALVVVVVVLSLRFLEGAGAGLEGLEGARVEVVRFMGDSTTVVWEAEVGNDSLDDSVTVVVLVVTKVVVEAEDGAAVALGTEGLRANISLIVLRPENSGRSRPD